MQKKDHKKYFQLNEGDIVLFYHIESQKKKYAINLEPIKIHQNKTTFNAVLVTSKNTNDIYPYDYLLPQGIMAKSTKVVCDQPTYIFKESIFKKIGQINSQDLNSIRKRTIRSLGFNI